VVKTNCLSEQTTAPLAAELGNMGQTQVERIYCTGMESACWIRLKKEN